MIDFANVSFRYAADLEPAVRNVSFHVGAGELVILAGRSGSGKSTLINMVNGLLPKHPGDELQGSVRICGKDVTSLPGYEIAGLVGSVFQNPKSQFFNLDTDSEIAFGLENAGVANPALRNRVAETIARLGIAELSGRGIFELSAGQKQRVALAGAYALSPAIYVLDEPSANLDTRSTAELAALLRWLTSQGAAVLISEHRLGYLADIANRYIVLDAGQMLGSYSAQQFESLSIRQRHDMGLRALTLDEATESRSQRSHTGPNPILAANGVTVCYRERQVLHDAAVELSPGEVVGLVGENGAGKTTLVRTLCGLRKPDAGEFRLDGRRVRYRKLKGTAFMVMQDVNSQLFGETVADECTLGPHTVTESDVTEGLRQLDLLDLRDRHPLSLSGGQKQRAAVASGLCSGRRLLVFDEPTSGLDRASMLAASKLIRKIADAGATVLVVSHDPEFLANVCTRIEELRDGQLQPPPEGITDVSGRLREFFGRNWLQADHPARQSQLQARTDRPTVAAKPG